MKEYKSVQKHKSMKHSLLKLNKMLPRELLQKNLETEVLTIWSIFSSYDMRF